MDPSLAPEFQLEHLGGGELLSVSGEVDLASSPELEALIGAVVPEKLLAIDLSACTYLDSSTLTVFVRAFKARGSRLCLVVPPDARIRRLFELTKLADVLTVVATRDDAFR